MIILQRWTLLLICVLMCFGTALSSAAASSAPITVAAAYNENTGQVTISGTVNSGQEKLVTVKVVNPLNQLDYLDQTTAGENGLYQFNYVLKKRINGTYFINVAGQNAGQTAGTTFEVKMTASASFDGQSTLTVWGALGTSAGNSFTVQIMDPLGKEVFKQEGVTGENGAYRVSYTISTLIAGNYVIHVRGLHAEAAATTTWYYTKPERDRDGGSGSSSPSPASPVTTLPNTQPVPASPKPEEAGHEVKLTPNVSVDSANGIVSAKLDTEELKKAASAGSSHVVIEFQDIEGAKQYQLETPASMFSTDSPKKITVVTPLSSVTMPGNMLSNANLDGAKVVGLVLSKADISQMSDGVKKGLEQKPAIDLSITIDGKTVTMNNPDVLFKITIPYQPTEQELNDPEHIVVWAVDHTGVAQAVPSGKYDAASGTVSLTTSQLHTFAVTFVKKSFTDLESVEWAKRAIEVMASKGIISGSTETSFNPAADITRADFIILLTKTFGFTADVKSNFSDVGSNDYYYEAIGIAKQLGLADGQGDEMFNPNEQILRQDMMVLLSRAMTKAGRLDAQGTASDLEPFADKTKVGSYAVNAIAAFIHAGIVEGSENMLNPTGNATRAEAAVLLYRIYNMVE